jgi:hypothetical protein
VVVAQRVVVIECRPNCVVAEPASGERVELRVRAFATATQMLVRGAPCAAPCRIIWRSVDVIRVRAGTGAKAITFAVSAAAGGREIAGTAAPDPAATDEAALAALLAEFAASGSTEAYEKIWGNAQVVPQRMDATIELDSAAFAIYNPDAIGYAPSTDGGLDDFFDDVVLLSGGGLTCTGIAVGERHVLTAAHCAGVTTIQVARSATRKEQFAVARIVEPPENDGIDIMLLVSERPLQLPLRPRSTAIADSAASGVVKIVGYGSTDGAGRSGAGTKRQATMTVGTWRCTPARAVRTGCVPDREIVIEGPSSDTCSGDSGGPALENVGGRWQLAGITSRGIPTTRGVCGGGGIYTSIGAIASWLEHEVNTR